jgi:hypothetical protein
MEPDPRPNIALSVKDHCCPGGNIWIWTDENGKPMRARCGGCNGVIKIAWAGDGNPWIGEPEIPGEANRQLATVSDRKSDEA